MKVATRSPSQPSFDEDHGVRCGEGERAVGGGILYDGPATSGFGVGANGPLDATFTTSETTTGDVPKYWYASIGSIFGGPIDARYKVIALCE